MTNIDYTKCLEAQDMIYLIMEETSSNTAEEAINHAVTREIHREILSAGYASIAFGLWGHDDPDRAWNTLDIPIIEMEFDKLRMNLIRDISEKEDVDFDTALSYFLLFTMEALGYHI